MTHPMTAGTCTGKGDFQTGSRQLSGSFKIYILSALNNFTFFVVAQIALHRYVSIVLVTTVKYISVERK